MTLLLAYCDVLREYPYNRGATGVAFPVFRGLLFSTFALNVLIAFITSSRHLKGQRRVALTVGCLQPKCDESQMSFLKTRRE